MPTLVLTQDDITPVPPDYEFGEYDGLFYYNESSPPWWTLSKYNILGSPFRIGSTWKNPNNTIIRGHWLRFKIPLEYNSRWVIDSAVLEFYWLPRLPYYQQIEPYPNANVNYNIVRTINKVHVYNNNGFDITWPTDQADSISKMNASGSVTWDNDQTRNDPGATISLVVTPTFNTLLQNYTVTNSNWSTNNHVLFFISSTPETLICDRQLRLFSWSHIYFLRYYNYVPDSYWNYKPRLRIVYHLATPGEGLGRHVEHTLDLTQSLDEYLRRLKINLQQALTITQEYTVVHEHHRSITQDLNIVQTVKPIQIFNLNLIQQLTIAQDIAYKHVFSRSLEQILDFTQTIDANSELNQTIRHDVSVLQDISLTKSLTRGVTHDLNLTQTVLGGGVKRKSVTQTLSLTQEFKNTNPTINPHTVTHTLLVEQWYGSSGSTPFVDKKVPGSVRTRGFEQNLTIQQSYLAYHPNKPKSGSSLCSRKDLLYADGPNLPVLIPSGELTLDFPLTSPTHTVTLPAPVFGNQEELEKTRIQRKTRAGDLKIYVDPTWPEKRKFRFTFEDLTDTQKIDFSLLVAVSLGQLVKLTDHEGRIWEGIITNPNGEFMHVFNECGTTAEFDFEYVEVQ